MALTTDPLFVGCTRPTLVGGVTYPAFVANAMICTVIFVGANNVFYLLFALPLHGFFYLLCSFDARIFELVHLWSLTKGRNLNKRYWKASSYSPFGAFRPSGPTKVKKEPSQP